MRQKKRKKPRRLNFLRPFILACKAKSTNAEAYLPSSRHVMCLHIHRFYPRKCLAVVCLYQSLSYCSDHGFILGECRARSAFAYEQFDLTLHSPLFYHLYDFYPLISTLILRCCHGFILRRV